MTAAIATKPLTTLERIQGCMFAAACGDALGHPVEFMSKISIGARYGAKGIQHFDGALGRITDDTQMSLAVIDGFARAPRLQGQVAARESVAHYAPHVAECFVKWSTAPMGGHRAPGGACMRGCAALERGVAWANAGDNVQGGGCGGIMRAHPYGLLLGRVGTTAQAVDLAAQCAAEHTKMTHRQPMGIAPAAALAAGIVMGLRGADLKATLLVIRNIAQIYDPGTTTAKLADVLANQTRSINPKVFAKYPAWRGDDALASAVHILTVFPDDPIEAIRAGANISGDSDSLASIVGALVGVRTGHAALVGEWLPKLEFADVIGAACVTVKRIGDDLSAGS